MLSEKIIKLPENFIDIFFGELEKLELKKDFYSIMFEFFWRNLDNNDKIEEETKIKILKYLRILENKRDTNFIFKEEGIIEENTDNISLDELINNGRKSIEKYILLFKLQNDIKFLLNFSHNTTQINSKKSDDNRKEYYTSLREAFLRNLYQFENKNKVLNKIRALDRQINNIDDEHKITENIDELKNEFEEKYGKEEKVEVETEDIEIVKKIVAEKAEEPEIIVEEVVKNEELKVEIEPKKQQPIIENNEPKIEETSILDFLNSKNQGWVEEIINFLKEFREYISNNDNKLSLLLEIKDDINKQEKLFEFLSIWKSKNEKDILFYLAYQIWKGNENVLDTSELDNKILKLGEKLEKIKLILEEKDEALKKAEAENAKLKEQLAKVEIVKPKEEVVDIERIKGIILWNLAKNLKRDRDEKSWYSIWLELLKDFDKIEWKFAKDVINKLKVDDIIDLYYKFILEELDIILYSKLKNDILLSDKNKKYFEYLEEKLKEIMNKTSWDKKNRLIKVLSS